MFDSRLVTVISDIFCSSHTSNTSHSMFIRPSFFCNYSNVDNHTEQVVRSFDLLIRFCYMWC